MYRMLGRGIVLLARTYRLTKKKDFRRTYDQGQSLAHPLLVLYYRKKADPIGPRIGISVSKKIGNAVIRNKTKRRIRAAIRPFLLQLSDDCDLIFIARAKIKQATYPEIERSMKNLLERSKLI